jgi:hypothetical protein
MRTIQDFNLLKKLLGIGMIRKLIRTVTIVEMSVGRNLQTIQ